MRVVEHPCSVIAIGAYQKNFVTWNRTGAVWTLFLHRITTDQ